MSRMKMQHCFNCGEELGIYASWPGDVEVCGDTKCQSEARYQAQCESDERFDRAREDDYMRY